MHPGLIEDLEHGHYFEQGAGRSQAQARAVASSPGRVGAVCIGESP